MDDIPSFLIHVPPNELPAVESIYVIVSVDANGEGVCGINGVPAVFANPRLVPIATAALRAAFPSRKLRLVRFSKREVIEGVFGFTQEGPIC